MLAATATILQTVYQSAQALAVWLAGKVLIIALLMVVLPFVVKGIIIWMFEYMTTYGLEIAAWVSTFIADQIEGSGLLGPGGQTAMEVPLSGIGGYLAIQTGLIDYCSIIFTGWGLYWTIAVLAKTTPRL
jgi:hypothetical protein